MLSRVTSCDGEMESCYLMSSHSKSCVILYGEYYTVSKRYGFYLQVAKIFHELSTSDPDVLSYGFYEWCIFQ